MESLWLHLYGGLVCQCDTDYHKGEPPAPKPQPKHPSKVHVWAGRGASNICIIKGTMDAVGYCVILEGHLIPFINSTYPWSHQFMQDNDPKYASNRVRVSWRAPHQPLEDTCRITKAQPYRKFAAWAKGIYQTGSEANIKIKTDWWDQKVLADGWHSQVQEIHREFAKSHPSCDWSHWRTNRLLTWRSLSDTIAKF